MKKIIKILITLLILIAILIAVLTFTPIAEKPIKKGIEHFGSKALKTSVTVDKVKLNIAEGTIALKNFRIANLEKFEQPYLFEMGEIDVSVNIKSLLSDTIMIKSINIKEPIIYIEDMGANLRAITQGLEKEKRNEEIVETNNESPTNQKKLAIKEFNLNGAGIVLSDKLVLPLPNIELKNLGTADNAATPVEITTEIFKVITRDTLKAIKDNVQNTGKKALNKLMNKWF